MVPGRGRNLPSASPPPKDAYLMDLSLTQIFSFSTNTESLPYTPVLPLCFTHTHFCPSPLPTGSDHNKAACDPVVLEITQQKAAAAQTRVRPYLRIYECKLLFIWERSLKCVYVYERVFLGPCLNFLSCLCPALSA